MTSCFVSSSSYSHFPAALRAAARTLDSIVDTICIKPTNESRRPFLRNHSTVRDPSSSSSTATDDGDTFFSDVIPASDPPRAPFSADHLIHRLSEIANLFSQSRPLAPESNAKPLGSDPAHYNVLMKSFSTAGRTDEVLRIFREMQQSECAPNVFCYTTVIDALVAANRSEEAEKVFEEMLESGLPLDATSYTVLVKLYSFYLKRFKSAFEVVKWMERSGCDPDVVTYSTLIAGLCRAGMVDEAWGVLDQMLQGKCSPNVHSYAPFLQTYCSKGKIEAALRLMESMRSLGCPPDTVSYNILINGLCKLGNFDEVARLMANSTSDGWEPDAVTYNTYINGLCKFRKAEEAFKQLEVMLDKRLCPTVVTINIVLDGICRESTALEGVRQLDRSLKLGLDVDVVSYNTIMSRLCEIGHFSWVLKLFTDMLKKGISPNTESFNILIHSLCKAGKLQKAKCMFTSKGFVADIVTCNILINEFIVAGKIGDLQLLFKEMDKEKISPDTVTYNTIIDRMCRNRKFTDAIIFVRSIEDGCISEPVAHLSYWLAREGKLKELLELFEEILLQGVVLDYCVFKHVIKAFCWTGACQSTSILKVCLVLDKMLQVE